MTRPTTSPAAATAPRPIGRVLFVVQVLGLPGAPQYLGHPRYGSLRMRAGQPPFGYPFADRPATALKRTLPAEAQDAAAAAGLHPEHYRLVRLDRETLEVLDD